MKKLEDRPDVKAARQQVASAKEGVTIAAGAHWPEPGRRRELLF